MGYLDKKINFHVKKIFLFSKKVENIWDKNLVNGIICLGFGEGILVWHNSWTIGIFARDYFLHTKSRI